MRSFLSYSDLIDILKIPPTLLAETAGIIFSSISPGMCQAVLPVIIEIPFILIITDYPYRFNMLVRQMLVRKTGEPLV